MRVTLTVYRIGIVAIGRVRPVYVLGRALVRASCEDALA